MGLRTPVCPQCGKKLGYSNLWKIRKYAEGRCSQCGGYFGVKYPAMAMVWMGISLPAVILLCIFIPGEVLEILAPLLLIFYLLLYLALPLLIKISKLQKNAASAKKRPDQTPPSEEVIKIYAAKQRQAAPVRREAPVEEKTTVVGRQAQSGPLTPEERYQAAHRRTAGGNPSYEARLRQTNPNKENKQISSRSRRQEEKDFFDNYGG